MKKTISIISIFFIQYIFSQNVPNNIDVPNFRPPTPETNSLFKFTDIPVSHTTGVPNISVPIYAIKLKDFVFPISLSYHSAGIHIEEVSSNIGLGWSLNSGGIISSNVIGLPDNGNRYPIPQDRELITDNFTNPTNCAPITDQDYLFLKELSNAGQERDIQPDIFYYNYPNSNGKFFISNDNKIHTMPYVPIKIIRENNFKYSITDEKGNKFTYDVLENRRTSWTIVSSISMISNTSGYMDSNSYFLSKIETANKETITLEYEDQSYEYNDPDTFTRFKTDYPTTTTGCTTNLPLYDEKQTTNTTTIYGKRLKSITSSTGENIIFFYDDCPRLDLPAKISVHQSQSTTGSFALNRIEVKKGIISDNYYFEHGYFNLNNYTPCVSQSNEETRNSYRLKLLSVRKNSDNPYEFEYDENYQLPNRLSDNYDHWGFFRNGGGRYPKDYVYSLYEGADRSPNLDYTKLGILKKIKYPTKGFSLFNYEQNDSFRVKIIENVPIDKGTSLYIEGNEELGIPNDPYNPSHLTQPFQISNVVPNSCFIICTTSTDLYQTSTNWTSIRITDDKGNSFSFVTTNNYTSQLSLPDGNYTLHVDGVFSGGGARIFWQERNVDSNSNAFENFKVGGLRIKSIFNYDNELGNTPSLKTFYEYNEFGNIQKSSGKIFSAPLYSYGVQKRELYCADCTGRLSRLVDNNQAYLAQNSRSIASLNGFLGNHIMYSQIRVFNQENKHEGYTDFRYKEVTSDNPHYMVTPNTPATSYDFLRGDLLEESVFKYNVTLNTFSLVRKKNYEYKFNFSNQDFFSPPSMPNENYCIGLNLTTLNTETSCSGSMGLTCDRAPASFLLGYYKLFSVWKYLEKTTESTFDVNGNNPITVETNYKYSNPLHSQITSVITSSSDKQVLETKYYYPSDYYGTVVYDKMRANNMIATLTDTQFFKNSEKLSEQKTTYKDWGNNLLAPEIIQTAKGNNVLEDKVKFSLVDNNNGNVLEYKKERGVPVSVIWGYNKTQPIAMIENATYASITASLITAAQTASNTGTEATLLTALTNLRNALPNAMVTTYTHIPLVGVRTITDPKGDVITYTYDSLGRLQFVKDKNGNILSENQYNYKQ